MQDKWKNYLTGEQFSIATMHQKERVIAPLFFEAWGAVGHVPEMLNTDLLGTFTGEVERDGDMLSVARRKCLMAMDLLNLDVGLASEGSFGPHPEWGYMPANWECVLFIDRKNGLEIQESILSAETNFAGKYVNSQADLMAFACQAAFPSHALILRNSRDKSEVIVKGLTDEQALCNHFQSIFDQYKTVFVETDMRAMYNPTRMNKIAQCTQKLIEKMKSQCSVCHTPGFGVAEAIAGLPCRQCATPTRSLLAYVYACEHCGCRQEKMYPHNKKYEDPMHCDSCNP
jgi:hypothetical protein